MMLVAHQKTARQANSDKGKRTGSAVNQFGALSSGVRVLIKTSSLFLPTHGEIAAGPVRLSLLSRCAIQPAILATPYPYVFDGQPQVASRMLTVAPVGSLACMYLCTGYGPQGQAAGASGLPPFPLSQEKSKQGSQLTKKPWVLPANIPNGSESPRGLAPFEI